MRTFILWLLAVCVVFLASACSGPAGSQAEKPAVLPEKVSPRVVAQGEIVLEAEGLALKDCAAKSLAGASGGKAVLFDKESSEARGTVELKKGKYKAVVYMEGASDDEDAVYVTVGQGSKTRVFADEHGAVVAGTLYESEDQFFTVTIDKEGPCSVVLTTAEKNVYVDRVVLARQE